MAQRAQIQEGMDSNGPYDSVEVGLDRNELMKIFAAMAREDAENEELARVTKQLRKEIQDEWEEDMNGDDIEVVGDEAALLSEFQDFVKELESYASLDNYLRLKLLQKIRKYGSHLPRDRSFKYLFNKGSPNYIIALLGIRDFAADSIRVNEALRILKKLVRYAEGLRNVAEGRALMEALKEQGLVETLVRLMKQFQIESYEIQKRAIQILFKFFWRGAVGKNQRNLARYRDLQAGDDDERFGTVDVDVRLRMLKEGGISELLHKIEAFPEYFSAYTINRARAMRQKFPDVEERPPVVAEGRGNSRKVMAGDEPTYWDRRGMKIGEYYKKRQSEGIPRRQREWDLSSDTGESEEEGGPGLTKEGRRKRGSSGSFYRTSSGEFASYHSFDNFVREGVYSDSSSRVASSGPSSFVNSVSSSPATGVRGGGGGGGGGGDFFAGQEDPFKKLMGEDLFSRNNARLHPTPRGSFSLQKGGYGGYGGDSAGDVGGSGGTGFRKRYSPGKPEYVQDITETQRLLPVKSSGSHKNVGINDGNVKSEPCCSCTLF